MITSQAVLEYFAVLDDALELLSHRQEGAISNLPAYALKNRRIRLGVSADGSAVAIKYEPDDGLTQDDIQEVVLTSVADVNAIINPFRTEGSTLASIANSPFYLVGGVVEYSSRNPLVPPAHQDHSMVGFGSGEQASMAFTPEGAKLDAIGMWNYALLERKPSGNFVLETRSVVDTFASIIRRKAFVERRIHRYLREHSRLLLPAHVSCFFEHEIRFGEDVRSADFILKREPGIPPMLIELESPVYNIFRKNGDLTAEANHAKGQIAEWVSFIDQDARTNASGEFFFLAGPKQRLVVMGRGLEDRSRMENTRFSDTTFWTYELLLAHARERWNDQIEAQHKLVGLPPQRPF